MPYTYLILLQSKILELVHREGLKTSMEERDVVQPFQGTRNRVSVDKQTCKQEAKDKTQSQRLAEPAHRIECSLEKHHKRADQARHARLRDDNRDK